MNRKKCVLIIDPGICFMRGREAGADSYFPRGAMSIATFLRSRGVCADLFFLDSLKPGFSARENLLYDTLKELLNERERYLIAIGGPFTLQYPSMRILARICRELSPSSHIALGGIHVSFLSAESLAETIEADSVIRGEGEWTAYSLAQALYHSLSLEKVEGITYRREGVICENPPRIPGDIEDLPVLDYGLIPTGLYDENMINLTASRGCAFRCSFCAEWRFWGNKVRMFPVEHILEEMRRISRISERPMFSLEDSMISMKSSYLFELCDAIGKFPRESFIICYIMSRVDTVSSEGFKAIRDAGILCVEFGIESLSDKVLKVMEKGITREKIYNACSMAQDEGVFVKTLWILGHPGDDAEQSEITLAEIEELYKRGLHQACTVSLFVPYPGTPIFHNPDKFGINVYKGSWDRWERYSAERPCELLDYPNSDLLKKYQKAGEVKTRYESIAHLKYYGRAGTEKIGGSHNLLVAPLDMGTHVVSVSHLDEFWNEISTEYAGSLVGIFFTKDEIHVRAGSQDAARKKKVEELALHLRESLGGLFNEANGRIAIINTNSGRLDNYALFKYLKDSARNHLKGLKGE